MAIDTFTIKFNEYELETILAALDDYRHYDDEGMDPEDLIGRTPVLARVNSIEDKISDINYIRGLTQRYESWSPKWEEKVDLAKEDLTMDEIDLAQYELRRISKKHRHFIFKQKI